MGGGKDGWMKEKKKRGRNERMYEHGWMMKERKVGWMGGWIYEWN